MNMVKKNRKKFLKSKKKKLTVKPPKRVSIKKSVFLRRKKINRITQKKRKIKRTKISHKSNRRVSNKSERKNVHLSRHKVNRSRPSDLLADSFFKAKIKVIGIGGGGGSIVSEIGRSLDKAQFVIADTDARAFKKRRRIKYFLFGQKLTHGLGTGLSPILGKMSAEQEKERITKLFEGQDMVIFVASLGGGVGSGAAPVFAEISKDFKGISFGIFTLPFKFEGKNKHKIAFKSLRQLRKYLNVSITIANEKIFKIIDSDTAITEAFSIVNKNLIESLESLIDLIYNPGIINIDFADLRAILKGKGNLAFLNTAEASGKDKLEKISREILYNPLYQNNNFIAQKILFNIAGGKNLSMFDVDKISKIIADQNPRAKIIFGISKNSKYKDKIKVTILISGSPIIKEKIIFKNPILEEKTKKKVNQNFTKKKLRKINKKKNKSTGNDSHIGLDNEKISLVNRLEPVFNNVSVDFEDSIKSSIIGDAKESKKIPITPISSRTHDRAGISSSRIHGKIGTIRRSALEIKKDQETEENKKSQQEKEWEIPAFLRLKK